MHLMPFPVAPGVKIAAAPVPLPVRLRPFPLVEAEVICTPSPVAPEPDVNTAPLPVAVIADVFDVEREISKPSEIVKLPVQVSAPKVVVPAFDPAMRIPPDAP